MTATAKTYDRQTATFLAVVGQNMPEISADAMQGWIENPRALQNTLRNALCPPETAAAPREFKTWKTIKIGTHKTVKDLSQALTDGGFQIGDHAAQILKKTSLADTETEIELVDVSGAELGFTKSYRRYELYARAEKFGLDLVPAEAGPQARLQYTDQPLVEWKLMAMEPIADSDGNLGVFGVERFVGGPSLSANYGDPGDEWGPDDHWVFARRKQN